MCDTMQGTTVDTATKDLNPSQLRELENSGSNINKLGANFAVCNAVGELLLLCEQKTVKSKKHSIITAASSFIKNSLSNDDGPLLIDNQFLAAGLRPESQTIGVALIDLGNACLCSSKEASPEIQQNARIISLSEMLRLLTKNFEAASQSQEQIEMFSTELAQTYEELVLLHKLSTNMKVTELDANFLQMACDSLTGIVSVEGIAVVLEKTIQDERRMVVTAGSGLIDINEQMVTLLHSRLIEEIANGKEALLDSEVDSPFKYEWSNNIRNIIAVPLCGKSKVESRSPAKNQNAGIMGLMVAVNRLDKQDFDSTDIKLFNSVANGCAVFVENGRLFRDLQELFIGSLKALTRSIDAKDQYTRGHSERVAYISRWIAEKLTGSHSLDEEQINTIYLAGLLHDIGKIGIDEAVLCKKGKLTDHEFDLIRMHPSIGAGILREIKQMWNVIPGVLSHHERVDGKGYPNRLTGDQVPLMAKIIGLADSFDAMTSKRTYRDAMTVDQAVAEVERGLGTQFDTEIGRIFISSDVYRLWNMMQEAFEDIYGNGNSIEYGTAAVGALIR